MKALDNGFYVKFMQLEIVLLEEKIKFGTKMDQGVEKSNWLGAIRKSMLKVISGRLWFSLPMFACKEENVKFLHFEFIK